MDDCVSINFSTNGKFDLNSLDHTQRPDYLIEATDTTCSSIEVVNLTFFASINCELLFLKLIKTQKFYKTYNALKKVSASITNIIRSTQITFEFVDNALLIYKRGFGLCYFDVFGNFLACKHWTQIAVYFLSKIGQLSCFVQRRLIFDP